MNLTPDKNDGTRMKISKFEKVQKLTTVVRTLQTDRKMKQNVKSPLMLILLLKKKIKTRLQQGFLKLNLYKNKGNFHKVVSKYISTILKFKIKYNQLYFLQRLKRNSKKAKFIVKALSSLNSWLNCKLKLNKTIGFGAINNIGKKGQKNQHTKTQNVGNLLKQPINATSSKKNQLNRSLDVNNKFSSSASKLSVYKRLQYEPETNVNLPEQIVKIKLENQSLKLMELSSEAREVLKKIQRFDRFIYAQQSEKICKQALSTQLKRLQKIKNSQKQMRLQMYDNQLTITALFNHIKLIGQMNRDLGDLTKLKQAYSKQQAKRKQEQFKANLQAKRGRNKSNTNNIEALIKQLSQNIQISLSKKDYDKAKTQLNQMINKYQKQQLVKQKIQLYKALLQSITHGKEVQKNLQDIVKLTNTLNSINFGLYTTSNAKELENTLKGFRASQKQINMILNRYTNPTTNKDVNKQQSQKIVNFLRSFEHLNNNLLQYLNTKIQSQRTSPVKQSPVKNVGFQLNINSPSTHPVNEESINIKKQYQQMLRAKLQFQKKINVILQKSKNKSDYKRQLQLLHKDKLFANQKPYTQFFVLQSILLNSYKQQNQLQISGINNFISSVNQIFNKDKIKAQARNKQISLLYENTIRKNPHLSDLVKTLQSLVGSVTKSVQNASNGNGINNNANINVNVIDESGKKFKTEYSSQKQKSIYPGRFKLKSQESEIKSVQKSLNKKDIDNEGKSQVQNTQKRITQLTVSLQKQKQAKTKVEKQLTNATQVLKTTETIQKKILQFIDKIKKNQQWMAQYDNMRKQRSITTNKTFQLFNKFYDIINDTTKKNKNMPIKIQKLMGSILKVMQKKNVVLDKKLTQIQKLFENAQKIDPHLQQIFKILLQWTKSNMNLLQLSQASSNANVTNNTGTANKQLQLQNKRLLDSIQTQRSKSKQLNQKLRSLQKLTTSRTDKSQQPRKIQAGKNTQVLAQLKTSKQKIQVLQKQLQTLKRQKSEKKLMNPITHNKTEENSEKPVQIKQEMKLLKQEINKLKQEIRHLKQKQTKQKSDKNKQEQLLFQTNKSIAAILQTLTNPINTNASKNYKLIQNQINKLVKSYEKQQRYVCNSGNLTGVLSGLIKLIIEKQSIEAVKVKEHNAISNKYIQILRNIQLQSTKKQYFKGDQCWANMQTEIYSQNQTENQNQTKDKVIVGIFRTIRKMSQISRLKLTDERKAIQKSIKSYENQLQKFNRVINQYQIQIKEKQHAYNQLFQAYDKLNNQGQRDKSKTKRKSSSSMKNSRRSFKSQSSAKYGDKDEKKSIKGSMQAFVEQQRTMLQKLSLSQTQKALLLQRIQVLQNDLKKSFSTIESLRSTVSNLQNTISQQYESYQKQYQLWKQKSIKHAKQLTDLRDQYSQQFEIKKQSIIRQYQNIGKQREFELEKYHKNFVNIQNALNDEIYHLKEQLKNKNLDSSSSNKNGTDDDGQQLLIEQSASKNNRKVAKQVSSHLQNIIHENQLLQIEIGNLKSRSRQLQKQIQYLQSLLQRSKLQQKSLQNKIQALQLELKNYKREVQILKNSTRVQQLEQQTNILKKMIDSLSFELQKTKDILIKETERFQMIKMVESRHVTNQPMPTQSKQMQANLEAELKKCAATIEQLNNELNNNRNVQTSQQLRIQQLLTQQNRGKQSISYLEQQLRQVKQDQQAKDKQKLNLQLTLREYKLKQQDQSIKFKQYVQQNYRLKQRIQVYEVDLNNLVKQNQQLVNFRNMFLELQHYKNTLQAQLSKHRNNNLSISESTARILNLQEQVKRTKIEQQQIINRQVNFALKNQEEDFNRFLVEHEKKIQEHFFTIVIPEKLKQFQLNFNNNLNANGTNLNRSESQLQLQREIEVQVQKVKEINKILQEKIQSQAKIAYEKQQKYGSQVRLAQENQRRLNQQIRELRDQISGLQTQLKIGHPNTSSSVNQRILQDDLKRTQTQLSQLSNKYNAQIQTTRALKKQISVIQGSQQALKLQIRRVETFWQTKLRQQATSYQRKINELTSSQARIQQNSYINLNNEQTKQLQSKLQQLNYKYNDQVNRRIQFEHKYNQSVSSFEARVHDIGNQSLIERTRLQSEVSILRDRNLDLENKLSQKQRKIRDVQQSRLRDLRDKQQQLSNNYNQVTYQYQNRIAQLLNEVNRLKITSISSSNNHIQCQRRYHDMQQRSFRQITELKAKVNEVTHTNKEVELLREVINNQKIQLRQLQVMANTFKESKQQAHRQKEQYFNELKNLSAQKDNELYRLRQEYENRITNLTIEKNKLQVQYRFKDESISALQSSTGRVKSAGSQSIKILELQSMVNNKNNEIKYLEDIVQRKRKESEEQHNKLVASERQKENLRMNCNSMQSHIMRLQTDISYFSNQIEKYKAIIYQLQNKQITLRNDLIKAKTQSDVQGNSTLREQISSLKQEIIRISTNNIQQINNINNIQPYDNTKINKMIRQIKVQRNSQKYGYDESQLELLQRINQEVSELVAINRQLQTKCVLLEAQIQTGGKYAENVDFFLILQDKIQLLINFLLEKNLIDNTDYYSKFILNAKQSLSLQDVQEYFNNLLNFMKSLFLMSNDLKSEQLRVKAQQMIELKEQMNQILDKHIQFAQDQSYQTLDKYKMIFSDIKILLKQFIKTRNQEYIQMIWRSLDPNESEQL